MNSKRHAETQGDEEREVKKSRAVEVETVDDNDRVLQVAPLPVVSTNSSVVVASSAATTTTTTTEGRQSPLVSGGTSSRQEGTVDLSVSQSQGQHISSHVSSTTNGSEESLAVRSSDIPDTTQSSPVVLSLSTESQHRRLVTPNQHNERQQQPVQHQKQEQQQQHNTKAMVCKEEPGEERQVTPFSSSSPQSLTSKSLCVAIKVPQDEPPNTDKDNVRESLLSMSTNIEISSASCTTVPVIPVSSSTAVVSSMENDILSMKPSPRRTIRQRTFWLLLLLVLCLTLGFIAMGMVWIAGRRCWVSSDACFAWQRQSWQGARAAISDLSLSLPVSQPVSTPTRTWLASTCLLSLQQMNLIVAAALDDARQQIDAAQTYVRTHLDETRESTWDGMEAFRSVVQRYLNRIAIVAKNQLSSTLESIKGVYDAVGMVTDRLGSIVMGGTTSFLTNCERWIKITYQSGQSWLYGLIANSTRPLRSLLHGVQTSWADMFRSDRTGCGKLTSNFRHVERELMELKLDVAQSSRGTNDILLAASSRVTEQGLALEAVMKEKQSLLEELNVRNKNLQQTAHALSFSEESLRVANEQNDAQKIALETLQTQLADSNQQLVLVSSQKVALESALSELQDQYDVLKHLPDTVAALQTNMDAAHRMVHQERQEQIRRGSKDRALLDAAVGEVETSKTQLAALKHKLLEAERELFVMALREAQHHDEKSLLQQDIVALSLDFAKMQDDLRHKTNELNAATASIDALESRLTDKDHVVEDLEDVLRLQQQRTIEAVNAVVSAAIQYERDAAARTVNFVSDMASKMKQQDDRQR